MTVHRPPVAVRSTVTRQNENHPGTFDLGKNVKVIAGDELGIGKGIVRRLGMGNNMYPSSSDGRSDRQGGWICQDVPRAQVRDHEEARHIYGMLAMA